MANHCGTPLRIRRDPFLSGLFRETRRDTPYVLPSAAPLILLIIGLAKHRIKFGLGRVESARQVLLFQW
jgi:hypothetical protein